jgi:hypothetical protein
MVSVLETTQSHANPKTIAVRLAFVIPRREPVQSSMNLTDLHALIETSAQKATRAKRDDVYLETLRLALRPLDAERQVNVLLTRERVRNRQDARLAATV